MQYKIAAHISGKRKAILSAYLFLASQSTSYKINDQCSHQQSDGALSKYVENLLLSLASVSASSRADHLDSEQKTRGEDNCPTE